VVGLVLLLALGALFVWRRVGTAASSGPRVIAVLPFENLGGTDEQYFADGMTDEIRGRLSALQGLQVIARGSSNQYLGSTKSPAEIARELGAQYLLTATVRWEKSAGGQSRVRVTPELVEIRGNAPPSTRWQQPFEAVISDVFKVQADIATQVAGALDVALAKDVRAKLEERPTRNVAAYDAYLQGLESFNQGDPNGLLTADGHFGRAVALDSTFVLAWAQLSRTNSLLYWLSRPLPSYAGAARGAVARAIALDPNASATHLARGDVHRFIESDWNKAIEQYNQARQVDPQNAEILSRSPSRSRARGCGRMPSRRSRRGCGWIRGPHGAAKDWLGRTSGSGAMTNPSETPIGSLPSPRDRPALSGQGDGPAGAGRPRGRPRRDGECPEERRPHCIGRILRQLLGPLLGAARRHEAVARSASARTVCRRSLGVEHRPGADPVSPG
jgi:TolB-like protein